MLLNYVLRHKNTSAVKSELSKKRGKIERTHPCLFNGPIFLFINFIYYILFIGLYNIIIIIIIIASEASFLVCSMALISI